MDNRITANTETISVNNVSKSIVELPINEDWACLFIALEKISDKIIKCKKLWDNSTNPKNFNIFCNNGVIPEIDSKIVAYRCGDYNSQGDSSQELHEIKVDGYSWITFGFIPNNFVKDKGNGTGVACKFNADKSITESGDMKPIATVEPVLYYHNGNPPYKEGRIYFAQNSSDGWLVWLPGFGDEKYTPEVEIDATTKIKLHCDNQGNVLDMTIESEPVQDDFWVYNLPAWWGPRTGEDTDINSKTMFTLFSDTHGEELGLDIERLEVEVWTLGWGEKITTLKKSYLSIYGYQQPCKYWLNDAGIKPPDAISEQPSSYYEEGKFIGYSDSPPSYIMDYPGGGVYPPAGQLDNNQVQYRIIEYLSDGTTRTTQKDQQSGLYRPASYNYQGPAFKPDQRNFYDTGAIRIGISGSSKNILYVYNWAGSFNPAHEGEEQWKGYLYREDVAGEWYLHSTIAVAGRWDLGTRYIYFPRKYTFWGVPYSTDYSKITILYMTCTYKGVEMWVGPIQGGFALCSNYGSW